MTALERIKEIEKEVPKLVGLDERHRGVIMLDTEHFAFLIKAFHAMREIAAKEFMDSGPTSTKKTSLKYIDQEFEERMNK